MYLLLAPFDGNSFIGVEKEVVGEWHRVPPQGREAKGEITGKGSSLRIWADTRSSTWAVQKPGTRNQCQT